MEKRNGTVSALQEMVRIARGMAEGRTPDSLLDDLLDALIRLTRTERGFLLHRNGDWKMLSSRHMNREEVTHVRGKISRTVLERLVQTGRPLRICDSELPPSESLRGQDVRSICALPIGRESAVYLDSPHGNGQLNGIDDQSLTAFCDLAALLLEQARSGEALTLAVAAREKELAEARSRLLKRESFGKMKGASPRMQRLYELIERFSRAPYPALLIGESGTGKELAARAIHDASPRKEGPYLAANCGSLHDSLLGSELFGHVRGAFTGADRDRAGLFELARGGTLFLDEVGCMSPGMQESLLRVVQENEIRRVGSDRSVRVDVRLVAASNINLEMLVAEGRFREDLYYRLNVLRIDLPPLRERPEDLCLLVPHLLDQIAQETGRTAREIDPVAMRQLARHDWPGNVRELENTLRRAVTLSSGPVLNLQDFAFLKSLPRKTEKILSVEGHIRETLRRFRETVPLTEIARRLGISRKTLWQKGKDFQG